MQQDLVMGIKEEIKQTSFENNGVMATVNILYTSNWIRDKTQPVYQKFGLLQQHYNVLRIVRGKHPKPVSPGEIKDVILDKGRDLTRLVDKLVNLGYLQRQLCEHNRRKMEITITEAGKDVVNEISTELNKFFNFFNLTDQEAQQLSDLLDKVRTA